MTQLTLFACHRKHRSIDSTLRPIDCKVYKALAGLSRKEGFAFIRQVKLAEKLKVKCRQTIAKSIKRLIAAGLIKVKRCFHSASHYWICRPLSDALQHRLLTLTRRGPYSTSSKDSTPSGERTPQIASQVAEYFGNAELGGKRADPALISRVARLVKDSSGFERFKNYWARWVKRHRPEGWGIFILLAEDAGRNQAPIINQTPVLQPVEQKPPILPSPAFIPSPQPMPVQSEHSLLAGLGIDPNRFAFGRR